MEKKYILVINPGSTSTKIGLFGDGNVIFTRNLSYSRDILKNYENVYEQKDLRLKGIIEALEENNISGEELIAVVGRGGLLRPMPGGTYLVTEGMVKDLKVGYQGEHASNLGGILAKEIGDKVNIKSYIVDPVAVDEFEEVARISGMPEIKRRSLVHALNINAVVRKISLSIGKEFNETSFIVAHLGGGISIAPVKNGKIIDVNCANDDGPFSPERSGGLPGGDLVKLAYSGKYTYSQLKKKTVGEGGLVAHLGTNEGREVLRRINEEQDKKAEFIFKAMTYNIAKEIGAMAAVLRGKMDGVILTGGLSNNAFVVERIKEYISFLGPIYIVPGEDELLALYLGAKRAEEGIEKYKIYEEEVDIND